MPWLLRVLSKILIGNVGNGNADILGSLSTMKISTSLYFKIKRDMGVAAGYTKRGTLVHIWHFHYNYRNDKTLCGKVSSRDRSSWYEGDHICPKCANIFIYRRLFGS